MNSKYMIVYLSSSVYTEKSQVLNQFVYRQQVIYLTPLTVLMGDVFFVA